MWRKIVTGVAIVMLVAGIGLFMFPIVSNFIGTQIANSETEKFDSRLENLVDDGLTCDDAYEQGKIDDEGYLLDENGNRASDNPVVFKADLDRLYKDSVEYNENLKTNQNSLLAYDYAYAQPSIDLSSYGITDGIYGYVSAESINMKLPIYLGANDATMSYGAAHLTYTSLPLGGKNTNTVLAGHTGYIGRIFFDNLRNLQIGDEVKLRNYWDNLTYRVVETKVCKPNQSQDIFIKKDRDLLTMITCISNNIGGFDRYYVICERN
ncbi:MAG: class C sortase [Ruminococcus sp.]